MVRIPDSRLPQALRLQHLFSAFPDNADADGGIALDGDDGFGGGVLAGLADEIHEVTVEGILLNAVTIGQVDTPYDLMVLGVRLDAEHVLEHNGHGDNTRPAHEVGASPSLLGIFGGVVLPNGTRLIEHLDHVIQGVATDIEGQIVVAHAIQALHSDWGYKVTERLVSVDELLKAAEDGTLEEAWGTGTAAVVSPIGHLFYNNKDYVVSNNQIGELTQKLYDELTGIQWGKREDVRNWCLKVK